MLSSVLFTGDAGGLNYVKNENSSFFSAFCCTCTQKDISQAEKDLAPIRCSTKAPKHGFKLTVEKMEAYSIELDAADVDKKSGFKWNPTLITKYSNVSTMRRNSSNVSNTKKKNREINVYEQIVNGMTKDKKDTPKQELQKKL